MEAGAGAVSDTHHASTPWKLIQRVYYGILMIMFSWESMEFSFWYLYVILTWIVDTGREGNIFDACYVITSFSCYLDYISLSIGMTGKSGCMKGEEIGRMGPPCNHP